MLQVIIAWLLDSKMIKTTAASAIGSGAVVIGVIEAKLIEVKDLAEKDKKYIIEYVDVRHDIANTKINTLLETQKEIKGTLVRMDERLYNINRKLKE